MKEDTVKMFLAAACAAVWSYARTLLWPLVILIIVMVIDYISGVAAAWAKKELSSRVGLLGIVKKLSYLALVVVGCVIDYLISYMGSAVSGMDITIKAVGLVVICWLIINELISILENVARQGGPVPPFLLPLLSHLKSSAEKQIPGDAAGSVSDLDHPAEGKHERKDD